MNKKLTVFMSSQPLQTKGINDSADKLHHTDKVISPGVGYTMFQ